MVRAHPASSNECDRYRLEKEIIILRTRDKVSFAEARSAALKSLSSHRDTYAQVVSRHKARQTVAVTPPRESSIPVLNSTSTPDSIPPILSPQTSLVVAEVHMDEAGTSAATHLSSTCLSESLEVDDLPAKVLMSADRLPDASGDETPAKIKQAASIYQLGRAPFAPEQILYCMYFLQETTLGAYDHPPPRGYSAFYSSKNPKQMHYGGTAILVSTSANDGSSVAVPQEVAELFAMVFAGESFMAPRSSEFKQVSGVEESRALDFGVGRGEAYIIFSVKEMRTAHLLIGDTSPGPDDIPFSML
ncbi:hypothetical protein Hamer_G004237 [Homarus americanus]|uniref:Uncharacterized protein n=1 Tax=Homarus americanus TaxID=6706 RepID=A0A8J5JR10_HOMAM|nr:hypothetical protein Hamer_G004237 [Homarus americanus]